MAIPRRVSPRFGNLPNCNENILMPNGSSSNQAPSTENIPNGSSSSSNQALSRRVSPRLHCIPESSTDQNIPNGLSSNQAPCTENIPNGSSLNQALSTKNIANGSSSNRRVSPRLHSIPESSTDQNIPNGSSLNQAPCTQNIPNGSSSNQVLSTENIAIGSSSNQALNRRVSPRLHSTPEPSNDQNIPNGTNSNSRQPPNRRFSPRLQGIPLEKRPYYGSSSRSNNPLDAPQDKPVVKKRRVVTSRPIPLSNGSVTLGNDENDADDSGEILSKPTLVFSMPKRVKSVLRLFNKYYLHFAKEEEERCRIVQRRNSRHRKKVTKRPDLKTISQMLKKKEVLRHERIFGDLPGIKVGHHFYSRAEVVAVGLHRHTLKGIDYIGKSFATSELRGYTFPLATSVVLSGQYEDDLDNREEIVYTGEGGNDLLGDKHQIKDQVLRRGNLALKNNKEQSVPVRLIRGHKCDDSYSKMLYIYDGLYKVVDFWDEKGKSGFKVFKYRLKRLEGQDKMASQNQVQFARGKASRVHSKSSGLVCNDISNGQEDKCIPVLNLCDPFVAPTGFKYIKSMQVAKNVRIPPDAPGCNCRGKCTSSRSCSCAQLNGGDFPYVARDGGRLLEAKDVVFECGPKCGCGPQCANRTSQQGLKYRLEVYYTKDKGWAVRSRDFIPSGAPVCEYIGILRKNNELDDISENDYIFDIDCWHTMKGIGERERRLGDVCLPASNLVNEVVDKTENDPEPEFCIDASSFGNIARFINHSCDPNLFVQCVLSSHHDVRLARIMLFAADNIPPMQELTYDYNYRLDSVIGPDGKIKQLACHCGAADCRKRLY